MTAVPLGQHEPGTPEWEDARRFRLGGSEVAAVLGLSPWESRLSLYLQKKGLIPRDYDDNPLQEWGRRIEPAIYAKFAEDHRNDWQPNPGMFHHPERRWQTANPDALAADDLAEFKVVHHAKQGEWGDDGTDEIPVHYRCQVLQYIDVHNLGGVWLAALLPGADYRVYRVDRDEVDIAIIREEGERFVTDLINNRPPDIDRHSATYQAVRELHPDIQPGAVEVEPELAGDYLAAYIAEKEAKADKEFHAAQIMAALGGTRDALVDTARFAYLSYKTTNGVKGKPFLAADQTRLDQITYPRTIREALNV